MAFEHTLRRLNPFEGLCLTSSDLADEQLYHRRSLQRHSLFLHGNGVVQGLQVELEQHGRSYIAVIKGGYGITSNGQGVQLTEDVQVPLEVPKNDGEYVLWLFHIEGVDSNSLRSVFDTQEQIGARMEEGVTPRLHRAEEDYRDAVALSRINVRLGRMVQLKIPVPRAGRQSRAAESYLKPKVVDFIALNRKLLDSLHRTAMTKEMGLSTMGFYSSLVTADFLLIEEGTTDRVLYQVAGRLIGYSHDYFNPLPHTTDRIAQFTEFVRRVYAEIPAAEQGDDSWLRWFQQFERLLQPLQRIVDELEATIEAMR